MNEHILYECGICNGLHPWDWNGDCRDDTTRFASPEDYAEKNDVTIFDIEICAWSERLSADTEAE